MLGPWLTRCQKWRAIWQGQNANDEPSETPDPWLLGADFLPPFAVISTGAHPDFLLRDTGGFIVGGVPVASSIRTTHQENLTVFST
jgi:hypothetical protein